MRGPAGSRDAALTEWSPGRAPDSLADAGAHRLRAVPRLHGSTSRCRQSTARSSNAAVMSWSAACRNARPSIPSRDQSKYDFLRFYAGEIRLVDPSGAGRMVRGSSTAVSTGMDARERETRIPRQMFCQQQQQLPARHTAGRCFVRKAASKPRLHRPCLDTLVAAWRSTTALSEERCSPRSPALQQAACRRRNAPSSAATLSMMPPSGWVTALGARWPPTKPGLFSALAHGLWSQEIVRLFEKYGDVERIDMKTGEATGAT